jgi:hypothetical protein
MTSEPDDKPRRRPPTIDLTATEVEAAKPVEAAESNTADAAPRSEAGKGNATASDSAPAPAASTNRVRPYVLGAVGGAILVLLIAAGLWSAGMMLPRDTAAPVAARADNAATDALAARLAKVESARAIPQIDPTLAARIATGEAETKSLADSVAAINRRLDNVEGAVRDARNRADEASAAADAARRAGQSNVQKADLDALANRIGALERSVKALGDDLAKRTSSADDRAARLVVAAQSLRAAVERGDPFGPELAAVKALGADANMLSPLAPLAAAGVPSAASLSRELSALTPGMRRAAGAVPGGGGFLDKLQANAEKLVRIRPIDAPAGDDPDAVISRVDADAARADIAGALAEIAKLPEDARGLADAWIAKAQARNAANAAARRIAADALAALAKPGSTQPGAQ